MNVEHPTTPFAGQKPGTSGVRKKTRVFMEKNYTENFVQSIFDALNDTEPEGIKGQTIVVGGDGRYFLKEAVDMIIRIACANGIGKIVLGKSGIYSTPAVSASIRHRQCLGGIILSASHNPGGIDEDFGIKFNGRNGGPAPEKVTNAIYEKTTTINRWMEPKDLSCPTDIDIDNLGVTTLRDGDFVVEVVDPTEDYVNLMKEIYDFDKIKTFLGGKKVLIDCMHGVTGPYAERIMIKELGVDKSNVMRSTVLADFGGGHPDPNLTYAADLVKAMDSGEYDFGCAFDGDGDRNMILGRQSFVTPSDSVAILAAHAKESIPYFKDGLKGVARSMPTSEALDRVGKALGVEVHEVPTGWKFFGNLMDAGRLSICGEESFGTGSDHIREKDGLWTMLAWFSVLAQTGKSVKEIQENHWRTYGRNYFSRYDYENIDGDGPKTMMDYIQTIVDDNSASGVCNEDLGGGRMITKVDSFDYTDPVDGSVSTKQGYRFYFKDGSRFVVRLSGTGSAGATVRLYIERYEAPDGDLLKDAQDALKPIIDIALKVIKLEQYTGRDKPTVIT
eukprot:Clim_evm16s18 gene=Clim_evmTU16s18